MRTGIGRAAMLLVAMLLVAVVAACGDDEGDTTSAAAPASEPASSAAPATEAASSEMASTDAAATDATSTEASTDAASTDAASTDAAATDAAADPLIPTQENVDDQKEAEPGSGEGVIIGYATSLETVPVVHVISEGIKSQAEKAGVELIFCDTRGDVTKALDCANTFKTRGVQGVLQFQHVTDASPSICKAGPQNVPTFAIDIPQPPCQTTFMGVDNAYGGFVAGVLAGETMKEQFDCEYDAWVSLEQPEIGEPNEQRMGGYREGFQTVCPGEIKNLQKVGFDATLTMARTLMTDVLTTLPDAKRIIVASIDDEGIQGAFAAADSAGRSGQLYGISLGVADDVTKCGILNNPNWLSSTAIFPERYGWTAIPNMIKAIKGEPAPELLYVPLVAVNSENISEVYPELSC
jgi:ribose transport system substrate-binding protein